MRNAQTLFLVDVSPRAITVRASDVEPQPVNWLWRGRIALGKLTIIAGDPGLGKSMLTTDIAAHVTKGLPLPVDLSPCPQGDVVMLSAEDDVADTIRPRLDAAGADPSRVHFLTAIKAPDVEGERIFSLRRDLQALADVLDELPNCKLIIIDPFSAYLDGIDSHKNADVRGLLAPLAQLAADYKVAIVGITHNNKSGQGNALHRAIGSIAFVAAARGALVVVKDKDTPRRRLVLPTKNNLGPDTHGLAYSIVTDEAGRPTIGWEPDPVEISADEALVPESEEIRSEREEATEWLKDVLSKGKLKTTELQKKAKQVGHSWRTVKRAKRVIGVIAEREGFGAEGAWFWRLPSSKGAKEVIEGQSQDMAPYGDRGPLCRNGDKERGEL